MRKQKTEVQEVNAEETTETVKPKGRPRTPRVTKPGESLYIAVDSDFLRGLSYFMLSKSTEDIKIQNSKRVAI